ncbi:hypothetical protein [Sorangium sp. So ce1335]|uniref:hypothetical protein n=1 Tax=Sorangium sp. So ce1335 TaxID=3133335 RepID=UPI003F5EDE9F
MNPTGTRARRARGVARAILLPIALVLLAACEESPPRPSEPERPAPPPPQPSAAAAPPAASAAATELPSAGAPGGAGDPQGSPAWQGTWEGRYDAKKGSVVLPPKVKDAVRQKDDGKVATGAGTVTVTIEPSGDLKGTAKGALGDATLVGKVEDGMVRASVFPEDPRAPNAMTGVLVGKLKDNTIQAEIRVAGPDAMLVRESAVELKKK